MSGALPWLWLAKSSAELRKSPPAAGGRRRGTECLLITTRTPRTARVPPPAAGKSGGRPGRRGTTMPLIEMARAANEAQAREGLQRWRARRADVWAHLAPSDVLVDSMRGRNSTWTRIRVSLRNVPESERPPQEALEVDYDPWAGYQGPDRSGQLERPKRRRPAD